MIGAVSNELITTGVTDRSFSGGCRAQNRRTGGNAIEYGAIRL